jgi:hypothetical protein
VRAAGGVVFLTAMPLSVLLIGAGTLDDRPSEVLAGLVVAALIGIPLLFAALRGRASRAD